MANKELLDFMAKKKDLFDLIERPKVVASVKDWRNILLPLNQAGSGEFFTFRETIFIHRVQVVIPIAPALASAFGFFIDDGVNDDRSAEGSASSALSNQWHFLSSVAGSVPIYDQMEMNCIANRITGFGTDQFLLNLWYNWQREL